MPDIDAYSVSEGIQVNWGLDLIRMLLQDEDNIIVEANRCDLKGFYDDTRSEYRERSVLRSESKGSILLPAPQPGRYYLSFVLYDGPGAEKIGVHIDGERLGVVVADVDDNREYVFTIAAPYEFKGGEKILLQTGESSGRYRIEHILFLKDKPQIQQKEYRITDVHAEALFSADGKVNARITWISTFPSASKVEYGLSDQYGDVVTDDSSLNSHRLILAHLESDKTYHYRIIADAPDGSAVQTPDLTFSTAPVSFGEGRVKRERVALNIENPYEWEYQHLPLTSGIPFPQGAVTSTDNMRILKPQGEEIPSQISELARWPDGSIKWALLDFQADLPGRGRFETCPYLEYGTEIKRTDFPSPLVVTDEEEAITVVTGPMKFVIDKNRFNLFDQVWRDENGDGKFTDDELVVQSGMKGGAFLTAPDGTIYSSLTPPNQVEVEECGSQRAVIKIEGEHISPDGKSLFAYIVRIHAYAGKSFVRLFYTFGNNVGESEFTAIKELQLSLPLLAEEKVSEPAKIHFQKDEREFKTYVVDASGRREISREECRYEGFVDKSGVAVAVRNFWQLYPKSFTICSKVRSNARSEAEFGSSNGTGGHTGAAPTRYVPDYKQNAISIGICPEIDHDAYAGHPEQEQDKLYYYLQNGEYQFKQGVTSRHELLFYFHPKSEEPDRSIYAAFQNPPRATADPEWYCRSQTFGDLLPVGQPKYPQYEEVMAGSLERYLAGREDGREYGMLNFGDWWGERRYNWGNIEYDTQHMFFLQYIRSGDRGFFFEGEAAARHNMDVDTVHYHQDANRIGGAYAHCMGHVGGYDWVGPKAIASGGFSISHTWVEGLLDYHFLTGDKRALETAIKIAEKYDRIRHYDFGNCRTSGWHLILTMAMYNATNDRYYLNAAKIIVDRVLERQTPETGGWERMMVPGHCHCEPPRHKGNAGFMVGILLAGLKAYHQATGDEAVEQSIIKGAEYLINEVWEPDINGFRYTSCPHSSKGTGNLRKLLGIAYAYRLTGDEKFGEIARRGAESGVKSLSGSGKGLSAHGRFAPYVLHDVQAV